MAVDVANAVKHSILFGIIILIAHFLLKNASVDSTVERLYSDSDSAATEAAEEAAAPKQATGEVAVAGNGTTAVAGNGSGNGNTASDLMEYVFGSKAANASKDDKKTMATNADPPGIMVVGRYENENTMCGGNLFDGSVAAAGVEAFGSGIGHPYS
jgi:hypothetical protein